MDVFGFALIGAVTGIGGGTLRDLLLGVRPVFWIADPTYVLVCVAVALLVFFAGPRLARSERMLLWADAVGLSLFCVLGADRALAAGASGIVAVLMGVMTAAFGGLVRDVLSAQVPLIMRKEIYATAAAAGSAAFVALQALGLTQPMAAVVGFATALAIRGAAIVFGWSLPVHRGLSS